MVNINVEQLFHCMKYDKKQFNNNQYFILLNKIGKTIIEKNIPANDSVNVLINTIKNNGDWVDP